MEAKGATIDRIRSVIGRVCEVDPGEIASQARLRGYGIDSVRVIELLMSIEEEFGIELNLEQLGRLTTVRELVDYIDQQRAQKEVRLDGTAKN